MDTLTQMALGAAIGEAALGRRAGNKAIVWGAVAAALPDLDVLVPWGDVVKSFTYHRSASHSVLVLAALTPLFVWMITKIHPREVGHRKRWLVAIYLAFATHALLDCFTAYGTQIFWPIVTTPVSWSTIFIIDPLYSLPLIIGVIAALVMSRESDRGHLINRAGLIASSAYLGWTVTAKSITQNDFETALAAQGIEYRKIFTTPTAFNSLLWRAVVRTDSAYYEAYRSVFDDNGEIRFHRYPSQDELLSEIDDHWPIARLKWFSRGFYSVSLSGRDVVINDLRMGVEPSYVFRFKVAQVSNPHPEPVTPRRIQNRWEDGLLQRILLRIWDESVDPRTLAARQVHPGVTATPYSPLPAATQAKPGGFH